MCLFIPVVSGRMNFDEDFDNDPRHRGLYCPKCHNMSVTAIKRREFIAVYWVPLVPVRWGQQLKCTICKWKKNFKKDDDLDKIAEDQNNYKNNPINVTAKN